MKRISLPALLLFLTGCATIIQGSSQTMLITSDPPGAVVTVDGVPLGTAPIIATVARKRPHTLSAALEGYSGDSLTIVPESRIGLLALSLITIYGLPVDLITGAHRSFPAEHIGFRLPSRDSMAQGERQRAHASRPPVPIGARIRVWHTALLSPAVTIGTLRAFSSDTLQVESGPPHAMLHRIPLSSTKSIDLSMGSARARSAARWAGRGALAGLLLGGLVGGAVDGGYGAVMLGGFGAMGGSVGGAVRGAMAGQVDRWRNVPCCATAPATPPAADAPARPARSATANHP